MLILELWELFQEHSFKRVSVLFNVMNTVIKNLNYVIFQGNQRSDGNGLVEKYKTFSIRNGGNDFKFIVFRDEVLQTMVRDRNFETQSMDLAVLYLDGEFWGVYDISEDYSEHYIENNYGINKDNVIIIKKDKVEAGVDSDMDLFKQTTDYIFSADLADPKEYAIKLVNNLILKDLLGMVHLIFSLKIEMEFSKIINWALWRAREPAPEIKQGDGMWRIMLFDTESSAGLNRNASNYDVATVLNDALDYTSSLSDRFGSKLLVTFMKNRNFKNLFINALCDIRNIDFALEKLNPLLDKIDRRVRRVMTDHFIRFGYEETVQEDPSKRYANQFYIFKTWLNGRHSFYMDYLAKVFNFKPAVKVSVTSDNFKKGGFKVNGENNVFTKKDKDYFKKNVLHLTAVPKKGRTFKYCKVGNCKFANSNYSINHNYKMKQTTVGVFPSKGCKVIAYFK